MISITGKTIASTQLFGVEGYDDEPYLKLTFTDDTFVFIEASYGGYTGNSLDEYPSFVLIKDTEPVLGGWSSTAPALVPKELT